MITIKLGELKSIIDGLNQLMGEKLPIKVAYSLTKLAKKVQEEAKLFEENRMNLVVQYCEKDEDDKPLIEKDQYKISNPESFNKEFLELSDVEVDIDFEPISINALEGLKISPMSMIAIEMFLEE